jgi:hypothetical protein
LTVCDNVERGNALCDVNCVAVELIGVGAKIFKR